MRTQGRHVALVVGEDVHVGLLGGCPSHCLWQGGRQCRAPDRLVCPISQVLICESLAQLDRAALEDTLLGLPDGHPSHHCHRHHSRRSTSVASGHAMIEDHIALIQALPHSHEQPLPCSRTVLLSGDRELHQVRSIEGDATALFRALIHTGNLKVDSRKMSLCRLSRYS